MSDLVPRSIDRAALERIIMRAAELQTADRDVGDKLSWDEVRQLGRDVGIPERFLQQALLEEQTRTPVAAVSGLPARLVGPSEVVAERVVQGTPEVLQQNLLGWIEEQELLAVQRQQPGRIDWEPLPGLQVAFKRSSAAFGGGRKPFMLSRAEQVTAITTDLEPGYCHVQMKARLNKDRNGRLAGGAVLLAGGVIGTGVLASAGALLVLMPVPLIAGGALAAVAWGTFRPHAARTRLGLERALDHLERGSVKPSHQLESGAPSLIQMVSEEIRKALKS